jgi:uncharacterized protein (TIGR02145 family)
MKKMIVIILWIFSLWSCVINDNEFIISEITKGTFIDLRDNHEYQWIKIGNQTWMAENLAYLPEIGEHNTDSLSLPDYYVYGYSGNNIIEAKLTDSYLRYGVLYNFFAAQTACPPGWHLPSDEEWKQLELALGMSVSHTEEIYPFSRGTNQGIQIKSVSGWEKEGNGTNSSGFSALPGGFRFCNGNFWFQGSFGFWWSSSIGPSETAFVRSLRSESQTICRNKNLKQNGFSIRCIKDN